MDALNICGRRIKEERKRKKMNQTDIVVALELDYNIIIDGSALSRMERNERYIKDFELIAISKILDVSLDCLIK